MTEPNGSWDAPQDSGPPDAVETDPAALNSAEDLDEDRLHADPLDKAMDPPEDWTGVTEYGMTPHEQATARALDERLAEEEPDVFEQAAPVARDERPAEAGAVHTEDALRPDMSPISDQAERTDGERTDEQERLADTYERDLGISADG
ncbi:MAG TPA: hypothetical protein VK083_05155 [Nocardia sp.]|uniref:hypothetical protein n=1 Tax=Nocardia TaxID=1817 RepID=UPI0024580C6E|nr:MULTISPECIES: hypothetical protein [Nocardia]HLS76160.1 hypothetical protein [Nocardia sp.]